MPKKGGVWYNPLSWFKSETEQAPLVAPATPAPAPLGGPYGGRKGRKSRKVRRGGNEEEKTKTEAEVITLEGEKTKNKGGRKGRKTRKARRS
jgi:hypothetical protein